MNAMKMYSSFFILGLFVLATTAQNETEIVKDNAVKRACLTEIQNYPKNSSKEENRHELLRYIVCVLEKGGWAQNETEIVEYDADQQACMTEVGIDPKNSTEENNQNELLIPYIMCWLKKNDLIKEYINNEEWILSDEELSKLTEHERKTVTCLRERGKNDSETTEKILNCAIRNDLLEIAFS